MGKDEISRAARDGIEPRRSRLNEAELLAWKLSRAGNQLTTRSTA